MVITLVVGEAGVSFQLESVARQGFRRPRPDTDATGLGMLGCHKMTNQQLLGRLWYA